MLDKDQILNSQKMPTILLYGQLLGVYCNFLKINCILSELNYSTISKS